MMATKTVNYFFVVYTFSDHYIIEESYFLDSNYLMGLSGQYFFAKYFELRPNTTLCTIIAWEIIVPNFCCNDKLSSTKLREWE